MFSWGRWIGAAVALLGMTATPRAEVAEVVLGQQFGAVYLPAMVMESQKLVEFIFANPREAVRDAAMER